MSLYFKKSGKGSPVIILHGLYGNSDNWHSVSKILSENYEVFVPDARNHGKSPKYKNHTYDSQQQDLFDFMKENHLEKATIIGHSMGGKTAMLFALLHPEMVEKLVVVDIAPKSYKSLLDYNPQIIEHMNILNAYASVDISKMQSRAEIEIAFSQYIKNNSLRNFLLKNASRDEEGHFYWSINVEVLQKSLPEIMDWPELVKEVRIPVLFIRGEKSGYILDDDISAIRKYFPMADLVTIFEAGHWVHSEQPERFINAVRNFLIS